MARYLVCIERKKDNCYQTQLFPIRTVTSPYDVTISEDTVVFFFVKANKEKMNGVLCSSIRTGKKTFEIDFRYEEWIDDIEKNTIYLRGKEVNDAEGMKAAIYNGTISHVQTNNGSRVCVVDV